MPKSKYSREREFGLLVGGIFVFFGGWWIFRDKFHAVRYWFLAAGSLGMLLALFAPQALVFPRRGWMAFAEGLSYVMTTLILGIVFFLVVTPIGLFKRLFGWDPLRRRSPGENSYWKPYPVRQQDPKHYEKLY